MTETTDIAAMPKMTLEDLLIRCTDYDDMSLSMDASELKMLKQHISLLEAERQRADYAVKVKDNDEQTALYWAKIASEALAENVALKGKQVPVGWEVCSPEWCNKHNACHEAPRIWFESEDGTGPHYHPSEYTAQQKPVAIDADIIRDANRYRFLRDEDAWGEDSDSWDFETRTGLISSENLMGGLSPDHFDAAIDARMAASDVPFLNPAKKPIELTVWYGAMPESNGKSNFTAILHRKGEGMLDGMTIDRSEYPERVLYAADRVRYLIGEKPDRPYILNYDAEKHSGYVGRPKSELLTRAEALAVETRALAESLKETPDASQT